MIPELLAFIFVFIIALVGYFAGRCLTSTAVGIICACIILIFLEKTQ